MYKPINIINNNNLMQYVLFKTNTLDWVYIGHAVLWNSIIFSVSLFFTGSQNEHRIKTNSNHNPYPLYWYNNHQVSTCQYPRKQMSLNLVEERIYYQDIHRKCVYQNLHIYQFSVLLSESRKTKHKYNKKS